MNRRIAILVIVVALAGLATCSLVTNRCAVCVVPADPSRFDEVR